MSDISKIKFNKLISPEAWDTYYRPLLKTHWDPNTALDKVSRNNAPKPKIINIKNEYENSQDVYDAMTIVSLYIMSDYAKRIIDILTEKNGDKEPQAKSPIAKLRNYIKHAEQECFFVTKNSINLSSYFNGIHTPHNPIKYWYREIHEKETKQKPELGILLERKPYIVFDWGPKGERLPILNLFTELAKVDKFYLNNFELFLQNKLSILLCTLPKNKFQKIQKVWQRHFLLYINICIKQQFQSNKKEK